MKKQILKLSWPIIAALISKLSVLWVIVEFILYLAKDTYFNWWSVFSVVFFSLAALIGGLSLAFSVAKKEADEIKEMKSRGFESKFQMRLRNALDKQKQSN